MDLSLEDHFLPWVELGDSQKALSIYSPFIVKASSIFGGNIKRGLTTTVYKGNLREFKM
jgi:hypothetical protein